MSLSKKLVSTIGPLITRYLELKRALGRKADAMQYTLERLDSFIASSGAEDLTSEVFSQWEMSFRQLALSTRRSRLQEVYRFCLFRRRTEPACFVPDPDQFPQSAPRPRPHIFSEDEIIRLLASTDTLRPHPQSPLHGQVSRLSIVLLYTTGLRRGELANLTLGDYDSVQHVLLLRETKFYKTRLLPLSADAATEINRYLEDRLQPAFPRCTDSPLLLNNCSGLGGYSGAALGNLIRKVIRTAGIRTSSGRSPRVHDFRFTFAVHAMLRWYRAGVDVQSRLAALSTYMGHVSVVSTEYYLKFVDAIAEAASERFAKYCSQRLIGFTGGAQ